MNEATTIFTEADRGALRSELIQRAQSDVRITGGAITGSAAAGQEDRWSDIDLAFGVREGVSLREVLQDFREFMRAAHGAVAELDVTSGTWIYRVFLLPNSLQVDIAVAPETEFRAKGPTFKLLFGTAAEPAHCPNPDPEVLIGWAWLYALHVRSCIARGKLWQADYMLARLRNQVMTIACLRLGLPTADGRGYDQLPAELLEQLKRTLVPELTSEAIRQGFEAGVESLITEVEKRTPATAERLAPTLRRLLDGD